MSEENNQDARPQDVKDLQKAIEDIHAYKNVVALGVFPGRNASEVSRLSAFLSETYKQLEAKFMEHPYIQDLIAKAKADQAAKNAESSESNNAVSQ
jgi:lipid A disaccharide synthetase